MSRIVSRELVTVAQLTGTCAGYGQGRRMTRQEALDELAEILASVKARPGSEKAVGLLSQAAALYVEPSGPGDEHWFPDALALLVEAGADLEQARRHRDDRRGRSATIAR